jgi:ferredoxin--NADP+ reductase
LKRPAALAARDTGARETIDCGIVIRAVGYRGRPLPDVLFDPARGLIADAAGRVLDSPGGAVRPGEYVAGWVKRGPSGVIGTNKQCAVETVAAIVADRDAGVLGRAERPTADELDAWLTTTCGAAVRWDGWTAIDAHEQERGAPAGRGSSWSTSRGCAPSRAPVSAAGAARCSGRGRCRRTTRGPRSARGG